MKYSKLFLTLFSTLIIFGCGERAPFTTLKMSDPVLPDVSTTNLSIPEAWGRWTDGSPVQFKFTHGLPKNFRLIITSRGAFGPISGKTIDVMVAESKQSFIASQERQTISLEFSNIARNVDTIFIGIPNPQSPKAMALSEDERKLGIGLVTVEIAPLN